MRRVGPDARSGEAPMAGEDPRSFLRRVRRHLAGRLVLAGALWTGVLVGLVLLTAWVAVGAEGWAQGSVTPLLLHLLVAAGLAGGTVAALRWARRHLSVPARARAAEGELGLPRGAVQVGVELAGGGPAGGSPALARAGARRVAETLEAHKPADLGGVAGHRLRRAVRWGGGALVAVLLSVAVAVALAPERTGSAWAGVLQPYGLVAEPIYPALAVAPGDARVERGEDVRVTITAVGRDRVILRRQTEGEAAVADTLPVEEGTATTTLGAVDAPVTYSAAELGGSETGTYRLDPVDPLMLSTIRLELTFPPHTGLPAETHEQVPRELAVPEGTRVEFEGRVNRPLSALELRPEGPEAEEEDPGPELRVDGADFAGTWSPTSSGRWVWRAILPGGSAPGPASGFPDLNVEVVPDRPPDVAILSPGRQAELPLSFRKPLEVEAVDDHGVETVELVAWPVDGSGDVGEERIHTLDAGGNREARLSPILDVSGWDLTAGDEVRYRVRAIDNAPDPGVGESEEHVLRLPGEAELRQASRETLDGASDRLEDMGERAREAAARARELERSSRRSGEDPGTSSGAAESVDAGDFQEAEAARQALEEREGLVEEVQELRAELDELAQALRDAGLLDVDLQRDLRELGGLLEELAPEEAAQELEDWRGRLEEEGADARSEVLEEVGDSQEALRDRLEESLERFRRAAAEEDFRALSQEGREVAEEEAELAERLAEEEDADTLARHAETQDHLEERAEQLDQRGEELAERLEALGEAEAAERAREALERFQEAQAAMEEAADRARDADGDGASQEAEEAAGALEEGLEELDEAHQEMAAEWAEALEEVLHELAGSALALARLQDGVGAALEGGGGPSAHELRREEAAILDGARTLARNAREVAAMNPQLAGNLAGALREAMDAMEETAGALGGMGPPTPSAVARATSERAVHGLNRVALLALDGGGGEGSEGGSDSMAEAMELLDQLAEQQGELAEEAGELTEMGDQGDGFPEAAEELGRRQQEVAEGLDELGRRPGFDESRLGDLEALEEEARELARELSGGELDPELRDRQEELFRRLLDAGRGIDQRGQGEERQGTPADEDAFDRPDVGPLTLDALNPLRFPFPTGAELEALPPAQRRLVVEYFQRLNRSEEGAPSPGEGS